MRITINWRNDNPDSIWNRLATKLGREPTNVEAADEVRRIILDANDYSTTPHSRSTAAMINPTTAPPTPASPISRAKRTGWNMSVS